MLTVLASSVCFSPVTPAQVSQWASSLTCPAVLWPSLLMPPMRMLSLTIGRSPSSTGDSVPVGLKAAASLGQNQGSHFPPTRPKP